jgi:hypothetical protein
VAAIATVSRVRNGAVAMEPLPTLCPSLCPLCQPSFDVEASSHCCGSEPREYPVDAELVPDCLAVFLPPSSSTLSEYISDTVGGAASFATSPRVSWVWGRVQEIGHPTGKRAAENFGSLLPRHIIPSWHIRSGGHNSALTSTRARLLTESSV